MHGAAAPATLPQTANPGGFPRQKGAEVMKAPITKRTPAGVHETAEMSVSAPEFALEDRFLHFLRGHIAGSSEIRNMLAAKRAGEPYRQEFTFVRQDDGWAISDGWGR